MVSWRKREKRRKALSYCRKSTLPKGIIDIKESIKYQEEEIEKYCEYENIELVKRYSDIGYSGKNINRPELQDMLEFLETSDEKIDVIIFYTVDRLGRDLKNNLGLIIRISEYVDEIIFVEDGTASTNTDFKETVIYKSLEAVAERKKILQRVMKGKGNKVIKQGAFIGPTKPLGYVKNGDGTLSLANFENTSDIEEIFGFEAIQYIFLAYLSNVSMTQIAKQLNENYGITRRQAKWDRKTVSYILHNPIYAGILSGEIQGSNYEVETNKVEQFLSEVSHFYIQTKLKYEKPGRRSNKNFLPLLSICSDCLLALRTTSDGKKIYCPQCEDEMISENYKMGVKDIFKDFLFKNYSDETIKELLESKKQLYLFQISSLQKEIKGFAERRMELGEEEGISYDYETYNQLKKINLHYENLAQKELEQIISFLQFLYEEEIPSILEIIKPKNEDSLFLNLPFLTVIDFKKNKVFLKFFKGIFKNAD